MSIGKVFWTAALAVFLGCSAEAISAETVAKTPSLAEQLPPKTKVSKDKATGLDIVTVQKSVRSAEQLRRIADERERQRRVIQNSNYLAIYGDFISDYIRNSPEARSELEELLKSTARDGEKKLQFFESLLLEDGRHQSLHNRFAYRVDVCKLSTDTKKPYYSVTVHFLEGPNLITKLDSKGPVITRQVERTLPLHLAKRTPRQSKETFVISENTFGKYVEFSLGLLEYSSEQALKIGQDSRASISDQLTNSDGEKARPQILIFPEGNVHAALYSPVGMFNVPPGKYCLYIIQEANCPLDDLVLAKQQYTVLDKPAKLVAESSKTVSGSDVPKELTEALGLSPEKQYTLTITAPFDLTTATLHGTVRRPVPVLGQVLVNVGIDCGSNKQKDYPAQQAYELFTGGQQKVADITVSPVPHTAQPVLPINPALLLLWNKATGDTIYNSIGAPSGASGGSGGNPIR